MNEDKDHDISFKDYGDYQEWERTYKPTPPSLSYAVKYMRENRIARIDDRNKLSMDDEFLWILRHSPSIVWLVQVWQALTGRTSGVRKGSPVRSIVRMADIFGLGLRREIKAMAAEYEREIKRLRRERRPLMARWNILQAWMNAIQLCFLAVPEKFRGWIRAALGFVVGYFMK